MEQILGTMVPSQMAHLPQATQQIVSPSIPGASPARIGPKVREKKRPSPSETDEALVGTYLIDQGMDCYKKMDGNWKATVPQLKLLCGQLGLKRKGSRIELMQSIVARLRSQSGEKQHFQQPLQEISSVHSTFPTTSRRGSTSTNVQPSVQRQQSLQSYQLSIHTQPPQQVAFLPITPSLSQQYLKSTSNNYDAGSAVQSSAVQHQNIPEFVPVLQESQHFHDPTQFNQERSFFPSSQTAHSSDTSENFSSLTFETFQHLRSPGGGAVYDPDFQ